jgi:hypothetical protein
LRTTKSTFAAAACCAASLTAVPVAYAHQTTVSNGVAVTMHIAPDDEPVAGERGSIILVGAKRKGWRFSRSACGCRLVVKDSSGSVLLSRRVRTRTTSFVFPRAGAYRVTFSGRVTRGSRSRSFNASFAYRAS